MHITANKALYMVPLHIAPIRLTGHTFLDDQGLDFAHYNPALVWIRDFGKITAMQSLLNCAMQALK